MKRVSQFFKVSEERYIKDFLDKYPNIDIMKIGAMYKDIKLPDRATTDSAGYDFYIPFDIELKPGEDVLVPTGVRCQITSGYVLLVYPRSSLGFKYHMTIANTTPVIDADYYYADNEGHIFIKIRNDGDKILSLNAGDRFVQGIFLEYGITVEDEVKVDRTGGLGSSGK